MSCHCHDHECEEKEEIEERNEKIRNIILLIWGTLCLLIAFILSKCDSTIAEIEWNLFSNSSFFSSLSFISFILYTIGYLPLLINIGKEAIEETKEGSIFNENTLMLVATIGAYGICEFPEALFVILFSIVGEALEDYATQKSKKSISTLVNNMPLYAHYVNDDQTITEKEPEDLKIGDKIEIRPGEKIPVDGIIISGHSSLDLSSINGESLPKDVTTSEKVFSGSVNLNSIIVIKVEKEFKDSTLSKIMSLVESEQEKKAKTEKFITRFAKIYTPIVLSIATLIFIIGFGLSSWSWSNGGRDYLYKSLSILLISCPCSLVIAVPISFFAGIGTASKHGILIKGSIALENISKSKTIIFDKTGTLTEGTFTLINNPNSEALKLAASLESKSTHPLAKAIIDGYDKELYQVDNFENIPGYGIKGDINSKTYIIGNLKLLKKYNVKNIKEEDTPYKVLYLALVDGEMISSFIVADKVKNEAKHVIDVLKKEGYSKTIMLSGDDDKIAKAVATEIGLDEVKGNLLPEEKLENVQSYLNKKEKVTYVGDGINDSPSILASDIGISMGALGSDAAIEASDIVIMDDSLEKITEVKHLAKHTMFISRLVIFLSLFLKIAVMILVLTGVTGNLSMIISGISDTGVMIVCVLVALTLLFYKPRYLSYK